MEPKKKVHFIVRHQNPITKTWEEKHLKEGPTPPMDQQTHLYTLVVREADNSYEIWIDQVSVAKGSMNQDFQPAFTTPETIPDPLETKPQDWIDAPKMEDPHATKPDDWDENQPAHVVDQDVTKPDGWLDDEPFMIPDPDANQPEDWDAEDDGEYEPPLISNPKCAAIGCGKWTPPMKANPAYKGKWTPPMIDNPDYKGEWAPQEIPNPEYHVEHHPARMHPIGAIALEIWTMSGGIVFDNIWLGHDVAAAQLYADQTWAKIHASEQSEQAKEDAESKAKVRQMMLDDGNWQNLAYLYATDARDYLLSLPRLVIFGVIALCVLGIVSCCTRKSDQEDDIAETWKETTTSPVAEAAASDNSKKDSKLRQRKPKAPKAD